MNPNSDRLIPIKIGLIGGIVVVMIALQGMIQAFTVRDTISGLLSMGETLLLLTYFATGYVSVIRSGTTKAVSTLVTGAAAGLIASLLLLLLVAVGSAVDLGSVFINATPQLYQLLTLKREAVTGSLMQLVLGTTAGIGAALIYVLPSRVRRPIVVGFIGILAFGFLQDWIIRTISNLPGVLREMVQFFSKLLYDSQGLVPMGALVLFLVIALLYFLWAEYGNAIGNSISKMPPTGRKAYRVTTIGIFGLLLLLLPVLFGIENSEILDNVGLYILMGLGLNIVVGFAGLLDLGYVAFYAIGAYTVGILTSPELGHAPILTNWWAALPFAVVVAVLAGILLGIPVLRMRGDYLAIVTLGFGEIIRLLAGSDLLKSVIGGAQGTRSIAKPDIGPIQFGIQNFTLPFLGQVQFQVQQEFYYLLLAGCLLAIFVASRVKKSRLGRSWMALREDEDVAQAMGINLVATKLMAFGMGAFFGGLSGAIFGSKLGSIYPNSFGFLISINVLALIIVGGMGNIPGVIVGAIALVGLPELLREFSDFRWLFYGAVLVIMMLTRPEGLLPEARRKLELEEFREQEGTPALGKEPAVLKTIGQP